MFFYRVILKVGYSEAWFNFADIKEAAEFARIVLEHQELNEDTTLKRSINVKVIKESIKVDDNYVDED